MHNLLRHLRFALIPKGPILDVGSGGAPLWRANILLDRFIDNDLQRSGALLKDRPLVCGDVHHLPFLDKSLSFVHCSHVLEHVDDPALAVSELLRVSHSGYIETPSPLQELLFLNMPFHRWLVWEDDGVLIFRPKPRTWNTTNCIVDGLKGPFRNLRDALTEYEELMFTKLFWAQDLSCQVMRDQDSIQPFFGHDCTSETVVSKEQQYQHPLKMRIKKILQRIYRHKIALPNLLACPRCKGRVFFSDSHVVCDTCSLGYPIHDGIPVMLITEGTPRRSSPLKETSTARHDS